MVVVAIIGGAGRMGAWFATFLKRNGHQVIIYDKNKARARKLAHEKKLRFVEDYALATSAADVIILATPTSVTKQILGQAALNPPTGKLLVEISSVKEPVRAIIQRLQRKGQEILSIHPMFGPGVKNLRTQSILVVSTPSRNRLAKKLLSLLEREGARIVRSDFETHDKYASAVLALPHFANIVFANTLRSLAINPNRLREMAGTTFRLQLLNAEAVHLEQPDNETSILMDSRQSVEVLEGFRKQTSAMVAMIKKGRKKSMTGHLKRSREFLQRDHLFADAYARFSEAVEASNLS